MTISRQEIVYENGDWTSWEYFRENVLSRPEAGIVIICIIVGYLYWLLRPNTQQMLKRMKELPQQQAHKKLKAVVLKEIREREHEGDNKSAISKIKEWQQSAAQANQIKTGPRSKIKVLRQKQQIQRYRDQSLLYETREERDYKIKQQQERVRQLQKEKKDRLEKQKKLWEEKQRKLLEQKQKKAAQDAKKKQISVAASAKQEDASEGIRSDKRKPTIEQRIKEDSNQQTQTKKTINASSTKMEFSFTNFNIPKTKDQVNSKPQDNISLPFQNSKPNQPVANIAVVPPQKPPANSIASAALNIPVPHNLDTKKRDNTIPSQIVGVSIPVVPRSVAPAQPVNVKLDFSSQQYLQTLAIFAQKVSITTEITTTMSNLGGARSSLIDLLTFSKSFINSINKEDDKQLTTFAIKLYDSIVNKLISNSNLRDGLQKMPPKSRTNQAQKNSINGYILIVNIYRLMGYQKVWNIVFGKTIKLLQFIYKRKQDLSNFKQLQLIANKYIEMRKQLSGKYLSRIDYLSYFLFGLTAFDPVLVFSQVEQKDRDVAKSRQEIQSWGSRWTYKQFWILTDAFFRNKHDSYFKPIMYMNLLAVLYPRVYEYKCNPANFQRENELYKIILDLSKQYFTRYRTIKEIEVLSEQSEGIDQGYKWEYDGQDFKQGIKVLQNRITVEKGGQFKLNAREFEGKANIFYYFSKQK